MALRIIKTQKQYNAGLERFEDIFQAAPGTPESDEADVLALLIKNYEEQKYVIEAPDPIPPKFPVLPVFFQNQKPEERP